MEKFAETFDRIGNVLIEKLDSHDANETIEFYPISALYALDVICGEFVIQSWKSKSKLFNSFLSLQNKKSYLNKRNGNGDRDKCLVKAQFRLCKCGEKVSEVKSVKCELANSEPNYLLVSYRIVYALNSRMYDFMLRKPYIFRFSNVAKTQSDALRVLHAFTDQVIWKRRQELSESRNENEEQCDESGVRKKRALLDLLLQSSVDGKPLGNLDIREEIDTFMYIHFKIIT